LNTQQKRVRKKESETCAHGGAQVKAHAKTIFEGSIVRALRRLHELLLQLDAACRAVGDLDIAGRFAQAAAKIHRGVVFTASLYL
jgi:superfamily II RNA helicase